MDITSFLIGKEVGGGSAPTPTYQDKEITITQNGEQTITADEGYDALSSVEITTNVPQPSGKITITENGTNIDVSSYATADVSVGGGVSDYFNSSITGSTNLNYPGWWKIVKKYPSLTATGTSMKYAFRSYYIDAPIPVVDASNIINFEECFCYCNGGANNSIDLSGWTFSNNITNLVSMFTSSNQLVSINLSSLGSVSGNSLDIHNMFKNCSSLKTINLENFNYDGTGVLRIYTMFEGCSSLEELDISKFDFTKATYYSGTFNNVPANCLIYVKDQTQKDWFTTNWPSLTNVQIKGA